MALIQRSFQTIYLIALVQDGQNFVWIHSSTKQAPMSQHLSLRSTKITHFHARSPILRNKVHLLIILTDVLIICPLATFYARRGMCSSEGGALAVVGAEILRARL